MGGRPGYLWDADIERATREHDLSPVLERHGTWAVTLFGVECLTEAYWVEYDRLGEPDWPDHMRMKGWVVWPDFMAALESARRLVAKGKTRRRFRTTCGAEARPRRARSLTLNGFSPARRVSVVASRLPSGANRVTPATVASLSR